MSTRLDPVEMAIDAIRNGKTVVVVDDEDRENEGDLIFAASKATPELAGFMTRHTSGVICVAMEGATLDRLGLPPMTHVNEDRKELLTQSVLMLVTVLILELVQRIARTQSKYFVIQQLNHGN